MTGMHNLLLSQSLPIKWYPYLRILCTTLLKVYVVFTTKKWNMFGFILQQVPFSWVIYWSKGLKSPQRELLWRTKCTWDNTWMLPWLSLCMCRRSHDWTLLRGWPTNTLLKHAPVERENMLLTVCNLLFK